MRGRSANGFSTARNLVIEKLVESGMLKAVADNVVVGDWNQGSVLVRRENRTPCRIFTKENPYSLQVRVDPAAAEVPEQCRFDFQAMLAAINV